METVAAERHMQVLRRGADGWPAGLERLHDPPSLLYARGRLELLERPLLAIVGTRRCTREARDFTVEIAQAVVAAGGVVLSGLALGIDGAAHEGALPDTIAVLGTGLDVHQPPSNAWLQKRIQREGLLLTEYEWGDAALPWHFPQRNRLIAALARAVLVVEAPARSGALITADHALDMGVEVMAVPGSLNRRASVGTNALLRDGAAVITEPRDVLDELGLTARRAGALDRLLHRARPVPADAPEPPGLDPNALALWRAAAEPGTVDDLIERSNVSPSAALGALLEMEMLGLVARGAGQVYRRA